MKVKWYKLMFNSSSNQTIIAYLITLLYELYYLRNLIEIKHSFLIKRICSNFIKRRSTSLLELLKAQKANRENRLLNSKNMAEFMDTIIKVNWNRYAKSISKKKRETFIIQKGPYYIWIEFFKDIRKVRPHL